MATAPPQAPASDVLRGDDVRRRVVHGSAQRALGFGAVNLITAATAVLLLRHLGVVRFGRYGTVMALLAVVQGVCDAGLGLTGVRELSLRETAEERRELLGSLIGLRIILSGAGIAFAIAFAAAAGYTRAMVEGTAVAGAGVFILDVQGSLLLPLGVELTNWKLALNDVVRQLTLACGFVVLSILGASLVPFFAAQLAAALAVLLITPLLLRRDHLTMPRWGRGELRRLATMTLPLAVSGMLTVIYFRLLVILISLLGSSALQIGYYVTSERVIEIFLGLPVMLVSVVLPVLSVSSREDPGRLRYVTFRMTQTMAAIGLLLALMLATGARPILVALGGGQYRPAAAVLAIQGLALITVFVTAAWSTTLVAMGRRRALVTCSALAVTSVAAFGTIGITLWQARGAAVAAVAADVVFCAALYVFVRRGGAAGALRPSAFARLGACALPGAAVALLSPLPAAANCPLAVAAYGLLALSTGSLPPELRPWGPGRRTFIRAHGGADR